MGTAIFSRHFLVVSSDKGGARAVARYGPQPPRQFWPPLQTAVLGRHIVDEAAACRAGVYSTVPSHASVWWSMTFLGLTTACTRSVVDGGQTARSTHAPSTANGSVDEGSDSEVDQMSPFDVSMARCALGFLPALIRRAVSCPRSDTGGHTSVRHLRFGQWRQLRSVAIWGISMGTPLVDTAVTLSDRCCCLADLHQRRPVSSSTLQGRAIALSIRYLHSKSSSSALASVSYSTCAPLQVPVATGRTASESGTPGSSSSSASSTPAGSSSRPSARRPCCWATSWSPDTSGAPEAL